MNGSLQFINRYREMHLETAKHQHFHLTEIKGARLSSFVMAAKRQRQRENIHEQPSSIHRTIRLTNWSSNVRPTTAYLANNRLGKTTEHIHNWNLFHSVVWKQADEPQPGSWKGSYARIHLAENYFKPHFEMWFEIEKSWRSISIAVQTELNAQQLRRVVVCYKRTLRLL